MEFSRLSERELRKFLVEYSPIPFPPGASLSQRAQILFSKLQESPTSTYPEVISDLYLASQLRPQIKNQPVYSFSQIQNLSPSELTAFGKSLGLTSNVTKARIFQILDFLNLVEESSSQELLFQSDVLTGICAYLTFPEANKLRVSKDLSNLNCRVAISDRDAQISSLPAVNADTAYLHSLIQKYGSQKTLLGVFGIYTREKIPRPSSREDQIRLAKILISEMSNFNYTSEYGAYPLSGAFSLDPEIVEMLLVKGADPNRMHDEETLLGIATQLKLSNRLENIKLLLKYGANPNPFTPQVYRNGQKVKLIDYLIALKDDPEIIRILQEAEARGQTQVQ